MQVAFCPLGRLVMCGGATGRFLRMSGSDALIELDNGRRVMWSAATEVEVLTDTEEVVQNVLPRLEEELARLESFSVGRYAELGIAVDTPCIELPKSFHEVFVHAALGEQPADAVLCRRCSSGLCIRADHLFWATSSDCQRDMCLRGVARAGGKKVTAETVALKIVKLRVRISRLKVKAQC